MKKTVCVLLFLLLTLSVFTACAASGDVEYTEHGLKFTLPKEMRRTASDVYEICYTTPEAVFSAMKLDEKRLASLEVDADITAAEYAELFLELNGIDASLCKITYNQKNRSYNFSYSQSSDGESYTYCRVMIVEAQSAFYYVGMSCSYDRSDEYEQIFGDIARGVIAE